MRSSLAPDGPAKDEPNAIFQTRRPTLAALEIAVGSHTNGAIPAHTAKTCAAQHDIEISTAAAGDIRVLNMLTLHRSRPSTSSAPRRTLRVDYAAGDLPPPLRWAV